MRSEQRPTSSAPGEWTAYTFQVPQPGTCALSLRAKAGAVPATLRLAVGQERQSAVVPVGDYGQLQAGTLALKAGPARLVISAQQGEVHLDWLELKRLAR